jgi:hypothetical protein
LNRELAKFVKDFANGAVSRPLGGSTRSYHSPKRRIRERLRAQDIAELIAAFKAGAAKWKLAEQYGIGIKSVKRLLREEGGARSATWQTIVTGSALCLGRMRGTEPVAV